MPTRCTPRRSSRKPGTASSRMKWLRSAERAARLVTAPRLAALFLDLLAGVAGRYVLGRPLAWSDEIAVVLFIWLVFWTGAFVLSIREHVAFDVVYDLLPPRLRTAIGMAGALWAGPPLPWGAPNGGHYRGLLCG